MPDVRSPGEAGLPGLTPETVRTIALRLAAFTLRNEARSRAFINLRCLAEEEQRQVAEALHGLAEALDGLCAPSPPGGLAPDRT